MQVTPGIMDNILVIAMKHLNAIYNELDANYPDRPIAASTLVAVGAMVGSLYSSDGNPKAREQMLAGLNIALKGTGTGWRVMPTN